MRSGGFRFFLCLMVSGMLAALSGECFAQGPEEAERPKTRKELRKEARQERKDLKNQPLELPELSRDGFRVTGGQRTEADSVRMHSADSLAHHADSLRTLIPADSTTVISTTEIVVDSASMESPLGRYEDMQSLPSEVATETVTHTEAIRGDTFEATETTIDGDSIFHLTGTIIPPDSTLTARQRRQLQRERDKADTLLYLHSPYFRDTIPPTRLTALSVVVPGLSQFYNGDYWKIPILYTATAVPLIFGIQQNKKYKVQKERYDYLYARDPYNRVEIDPVQRKMIKHNTWQQLLFGAAAGSYIYFLGDGVVNYPVQLNGVQAATTLSMVCPGAGQIYNGSYWRSVIVAGGFASFVYVIDWNTRGWNRFKTAIAIRNDGDPNTVDEFSSTMDEAALRSWRDNYRRNRDLCYILTAAFYVLNIIDAHVDAHLQDYDVSDKLAFRMRLEPTMNLASTFQGGTTATFGLNLNLTF